ncbi:MAG: hypothetical protein EOP10_14095 [Proteobacteria bacterium]|nr:MAG: hypothetical protein EOP10_14095 [Pseudomonadota bacterium]
MHEQVGFSATTSSGVIWLRGLLLENSNFYGLEEALSGDFETMDFSQLKKASWNGLLKLNGVLSKKVKKSGQAVNVRAIPFEIYRFFRMLPHFKSNFRIESAELSTGSGKYQLYSSQELKADHESGQENAYFSGASFARIVGRKINFPGLVAPRSEEARSYRMLTDYLYDYLLFAETIFASSTDLAEGLGVTIRQVNTDASRILEKSRLAFESMNFSYDRSFYASLQKTVGGLDESINRYSSSITGVTNAVCNSLALLSQKAQKAVQSSEPYGQVHVKDIAENVLKAQTVTKVAEDLGVTAGELFLYAEVMTNGFSFAEHLKTQDLSHGQIAKLIDIYGITDPMADEKAVLLENIEQIYQGAARSVYALSTTSQGCDLIRQILEHRIEEAQVMLTFVERFKDRLCESDITAQFKKDVNDTIKRKMVTDQEKFAFAFFIADEYPASAKEASAYPGDVLLF